MNATRPPRAVLDSDVIYSRVLHELFGRLASEARLLTIVWSEELLDEAYRVLIDRKGLEPAVAPRWVSYLSEAFPAGAVDIAMTMRSEPLDDLTVDPDDRHVCALAIGGRADLLITNDRGFLAKALAHRGVEVISPDRLLTRVLDCEPTPVLDALTAQAAAWGGGRPVGQLLAALERAGAREFATAARTGSAHAPAQPPPPPE